MEWKPLKTALLFLAFAFSLHSAGIMPQKLKTFVKKILFKSDPFCCDGGSLRLNIDLEIQIFFIGNKISTQKCYDIH